jgi:hypothetical protein
MATTPEPVSVEELKLDVLHMIATRYGDRPLTWDVGTKALALASFELKQAALAAMAAEGRKV